MFRNFFASITHNAISLIGTALAVASMVLIASLFTMEQLGFEGGPYLGILTYLVIPMIFVIGLILIPVGAILWRRRMRRTPGGERTPLFPVFDLNATHTRRWLLVFVGATMVNIVILASATYKGVEVMESVEFCGMACHSVMEPEHTAHARSPHSRVACADCHIGPGANWFVKSKLDGAWQLVSVALDLYPRPVPTPLHDLRPARDTCEQCHWPTKFVGDKLRVIKHYDDDEANTELTTALLLRVGGANGGESSGIHWHVDPNVAIRYRSDETREEIYEVEFTNADGTVMHYADRRAPDEGGIWRTMDCVVPFIKREGLRVIDVEYASHEEARAAINEELQAFYADNYPDLATEKAEAIDAAATALGDVYSVNVFPDMQVWWDTYPNHIGHDQSPGCIRCHSRRMRTEERQQISSDCSNCHVLLADKEVDPHILTLLSTE
jgi:hypothetical protein